MGIRCFLVVPAEKVLISRTRESAERCSRTVYGTHYARVEELHNLPVDRDAAELLAATPPPVACVCGYEFTEQDGRGRGAAVRFWARADDPEVEWPSLAEVPPGGMWDATWYHDSPQFCGPDGRCIVVKCPNGFDWMVDGRCSNCPEPCRDCGVAYVSHSAANSQACRQYYPRDDYAHKCWIRHGALPVITVDKNGGPTCAAGAGSIQAGDYHGHLLQGEFTP